MSMFVEFHEFPWNGPELLAERRFAWSEPYAWKLPVSLWLEAMASALDGGWQQRVSRRQARAMRRRNGPASAGRLRVGAR